MRRFKLQVQVTANGYMTGPNGEMDWMTSPWSDDMMAYSGALHESVDCIVLSRTLAEGFIPSWAARRDDPQGETQETIEWMNNTPKVVFSKTLTDSPWENATVASGDLPETVGKLKTQPGGDLITYGGGTFISGLITQGLLDELHVYLHPTVIGSGITVFGNLAGYQRLRLVTAQPFDCGVTALQYEPTRS